MSTLGGITTDQGIVLQTGFFVLDWTVKFARITVTVDGSPAEMPWGEHFFPLAPGAHRLQVSYRHAPFTRAGQAEAVVEVGVGQVTRVSYEAPKSVLWAFRPGTLTIQP